MILPSKHLSQNRALLTVGARILRHLKQPKTISALWEDIPRNLNCALRYDGFVLALDLLFLIGTIELQDGILFRRIS